MKIGKGNKYICKNGIEHSEEVWHKSDVIGLLEQQEQEFEQMIDDKDKQLDESRKIAEMRKDRELEGICFHIGMTLHRLKQKLKGET